MKNLKRKIDERNDTVICTKGLTNEKLKELVDYMNENDSIVDSLVLPEGSLSGEGIQYLAKNYNKLYSLDISDNNLTDEDVVNIIGMSNLQELSICNNFLSKKAINQLENMNLKYVEYDGNNGEEKYEEKEPTNSEIVHFTFSFDKLSASIKKDDFLTKDFKTKMAELMQIPGVIQCVKEILYEIEQK